MPRIRIQSESVRIIHGDARQTGLPDAFFHCVATSPPYFGLREYGDDVREIGDEPTPDEYIAEMRKVGREVWRVLRDDGTWWLNLGDSFGGVGDRSGKNNGFAERSAKQYRGGSHKSADSVNGAGANIKSPGHAKSLLMIPQRVALALQVDGWIVRAQIPWVKANCMPESVRDRPTVAHEYVFLLAKSQRYFWDADAVSMPPNPNTERRAHLGSRPTPKTIAAEQNGTHGANGRLCAFDSHGRNLRTSDFFHAGLDALETHLAHVRENGGLLLSPDGDPLAFMVNPVGNKLAHFAMWPPRLVAPMIKASTSEKGCCPKCGAQWQRVVEKSGSNWEQRKAVGVPSRYGKHPSKGYEITSVGMSLSATLGFAPSCECNAGDPIPCRVLDPFAGSGTTLQVCEALGRDSWGVELMAKNIPIIDKRLKEKLDPELMKPIKLPAKRSKSQAVISS